MQLSICILVSRIWWDGLENIRIYVILVIWFKGKMQRLMKPRIFFVIFHYFYIKLDYWQGVIWSPLYPCSVINTILLTYAIIGANDEKNYTLSFVIWYAFISGLNILSTWVLMIFNISGNEFAFISLMLWFDRQSVTSLRVMNIDMKRPGAIWYIAQGLYISNLHSHYHTFTRALS